jgi:branched-subunit amino acid aminotransferase/4-amino-4-deoxychorismate lyase
MSTPTSHYPTASPARPGPAQGLRVHASSLREHADRLRAAAEVLDWDGPQADAFRARLNLLARRCSTAADGLARSAAGLG